MACTAAEAEMGVTAKLGFAETNPGTPPANPTEMAEFQSDNVSERKSFIRTDGIRGTVALPSDRTVPNRRIVQGQFRIQPTPTDVDRWINRITGADSGENLAETLPCFDQFSLRGGWCFKYRECKVARAEFSSSEGQPLALQIDVIGRQRDDPAANNYSWPSGISLPAGTPWMFQEVVLTLAGTTYRFRTFRLTIDNGLEPRFMNSLTLTDLKRMERNITLTLENPFGTSKANLTSFRAGAASGSLVFTSGTNVLTFDMPALRAMEIDDPTVQSKDEIMLPLNLVARYDTTPGDELNITLETS
jgi:hypothetical protein